MQGDFFPVYALILPMCIVGKFSLSEFILSSSLRSTLGLRILFVSLLSSCCAISLGFGSYLVPG